MQNRNYYIKYCLFVLMIILVSCSRDSISIVEESNKSSSVPLQIGGISFTGVSTRSTTPLLVGDIGIFRLTSTGYVGTKSNVQYINNGDGWNVASGIEPIYVTKSKANLFAYYPYNSDESFTDESLTLTSQLYTDNTDICYQTGVTTDSDSPVSFTMDHAYAKFVFNLTRSDDYSGDCAVSNITIANNGILVSNTLDISTGTYGNGTIGTITINPDINSISSGSTETVNILMVPVATLSGDITLTFTIDGKDKSTTVDVSTYDITSIKAGNDYIINITINKFIPEITTTANCYMISPGNSLTIPVNVRGNGRGVAGTGISTDISPLSVGLLWETSKGLISLSNMSSDEKVNITASSETGNAVIAAYSGANQSGEILWSWHIWITDYDPDASLNGTTFSLTNSAGASYIFMDRNLGATTVTPATVTTLGLLYQWGRKDPFPGSTKVSDEEGVEPTLYNASGVSSTTMITKTAVSETSNLDNAIQNPMTFYYGTSTSGYDWYSSNGTYNDSLWGGANINTPDDKTIFDPSPVGWRVPSYKGSESPWTAFTTSTFTWSATNYGHTYNNMDFYPAAGIRVSYSGTFSGVGIYGLYCSGSTYNNDKDAISISTNTNLLPADESIGIRVHAMYFNSSSVESINSSGADAFSVRCVKE